MPRIGRVGWGNQTPFYLRNPRQQQIDMLSTMTREERLMAYEEYKAGTRHSFPCIAWANRWPEEVPVVNGEWEFIAIRTPELAE